MFRPLAEGAARELLHSAGHDEDHSLADVLHGVDGASETATTSAPTNVVLAPPEAMLATRTLPRGPQRLVPGALARPVASAQCKPRGSAELRA